MKWTTLIRNYKLEMKMISINFFEYWGEDGAE